MTVWQAYIDKADWKTLSDREKERLLNYEYGFAAYIADKDPAAADLYVKQFNTHIEDFAAFLSPATLTSYRSAYCAYMTKIDKWHMISFASKALKYAQEAIEADTRNTIALVLYGNVKMYSPKTFGGDKAVALQYYERAETLYEDANNTRNNWNYRALQLCKVQCYEKMGQIEQAIEQCNIILQDEPDFTYLRDIYLPILESKKGATDTAITY